MKKNILNFLTYASLSILLLLIAGIFYIYYSIRTETQDVLFQASSEDALIKINGETVGKGAVCVPNLKIGDYTFAVQQETEVLQELFSVSDNTVAQKTGEVFQRPDVPSTLIKRKDLSLEVKLFNCADFIPE